MNVLAGIGILGISGGVIASLAVLRGWVLITLWGWFLAPHFGLSMISMPIAIGICLIAALVTKDIPVMLKEQYLDNTIHPLVLEFTQPFLLLLTGYCVTKCI